MLIDHVAPYPSGEFYRRELPPIRAVLADVGPLYVTAAGIPPAAAAELVRPMTGRFRLPDALRRVDTLARGTAAS